MKNTELITLLVSMAVSHGLAQELAFKVKVFDAETHLPHDNADIIRHDPLLRHEEADHADRDALALALVAVKDDRLGLIVFGLILNRAPHLAAIGVSSKLGNSVRRCLGKLWIGFHPFCP